MAKPDEPYTTTASVRVTDREKRVLKLLVEAGAAPSVHELLRPRIEELMKQAEAMGEISKELTEA